MNSLTTDLTTELLTSKTKSYEKVLIINFKLKKNDTLQPRIFQKAVLLFTVYTFIISLKPRNFQFTVTRMHYNFA